MALILVTGSSDGIGLETARQLAARGAEVLIHGRNPQRVAAAHRTVVDRVQRPLPDPVIADLSSLAGARALAAELERRQLHPAVVVNNAGVYLRQLEKSPDGIELTMAVNHFAPFVLTRALLAQAGCALERVVNVSSGVHIGGHLDLDDIELLRRRYDGYDAYAASKLANVLFTVELARRHPELAVNALHPGVVSTKLLTQGFGSSGPDSLEASARTSVMLALDAPYRKVSGEYFAHERKATMSALARDADFTRAFFDKSAERTARA